MEWLAFLYHVHEMFIKLQTQKDMQALNTQGDWWQLDINLNEMQMSGPSSLK